jgi:UPF0716 family protein affecting phage T7 exclusion
VTDATAFTDGVEALQSIAIAVIAVGVTIGLVLTVVGIWLLRKQGKTGVDAANDNCSCPILWLQL